MDACISVWAPYNVGMKKKNEVVELFEKKTIRKVWHQEQWFFSVSDVVQILTETSNVKDYLKKLRKRDIELSVKWGTICPPLDVISKDGKTRKEITANLEDLFRIIQSIPSPKAEPFKQWLARVGKERIDEINDPELAVARAKETYAKKGYSDTWINKRMRSIHVRNSLTDEWRNRGAKLPAEFAILTDEIYKGTFEMTAQQYKKLKELDKEDNLRDHMNDIELILTMLGEATTTTLTQERDSKGFPKLERDAKDGGEVAGGARKHVERKSGRRVAKKGTSLSW
jgi:hypothetical protein